MCPAQPSTIGYHTAKYSLHVIGFALIWDRDRCLPTALQVADRKQQAKSFTYTFIDETQKKTKKTAFEPDLVYTWTHVQSAVNAKQEADVFLAAIAAQADASKKRVIADRELKWLS